MIASTRNLRPDWIENKADRLIARAQRSQFRQEIFDDAKRLIKANGYASDVALMMSLRYWEGCPITGTVAGV